MCLDSFEVTTNRKHEFIRIRARLEGVSNSVHSSLARVSLTEAAAADLQHRPSGPPLASQRRPNSVVARVVRWAATTTLFGRAAASFADGRTNQRRASRGVPGSGMCETRDTAGSLDRHIPYPARPEGCAGLGGARDGRSRPPTAAKGTAPPPDVPSQTISGLTRDRLW